MEKGVIDPLFYLCYNVPMIKNILTIVAILSVIGCSHRPIRYVQYTDDEYVIAARTNKVEVQARRTTPFNETRNVWVDVWYIRLVNNHKDQDWCAGIEWRSMDYSINVPNAWFYVPAQHKMNIGAAVQRTWELGNDTITINDAAFMVFRLNLRKPNGGECFINEE